MVNTHSTLDELDGLLLYILHDQRERGWSEITAIRNIIGYFSNIISSQVFPQNREDITQKEFTKRGV
jgi:hypothetical protein